MWLESAEGVGRTCVSQRRTVAEMSARRRFTYNENGLYAGLGIHRAD